MMLMSNHLTQMFFVFRRNPLDQCADRYDPLKPPLFFLQCIAIAFSLLVIEILIQMLKCLLDYKTIRVSDSLSMSLNFQLFKIEI